MIFLTAKYEWKKMKYQFKQKKSQIVRSCFDIEVETVSKGTNNDSSRQMTMNYRADCFG